MIRQAHITTLRAGARLLAAALLATMALPLSPAGAQDSSATRAAPKSTAKPGAKPASAATKADSGKPATAAAKPATAKEASAKAETKGGVAGKPTLIASIGDWGVYATPAGRERTCYALAQPKDRLPSALKRDPAYLFISTRPSENVRNEVSIIMGFDVKTEKIPAEAAIGSEKFAMAAQGSHLWVRDAEQGTPMVEALRKGSKLTVKAASARGNQTTDSYSLTGLKTALERVQKECP
ncbi:MAG: uncharacterized protein JWL62_686 [Hyphomicrobiales bacterium]|nr:uncharacterized protein [Hyphomicrobiales bacterium]